MAPANEEVETAKDIVCDLFIRKSVLVSLTHNERRQEGKRDQIKKWTLRKCPLAQERTKNSKKLQINYPRPL